eukprot:Gb_08651 [translate_table: standard]
MNSFAVRRLTSYRTMGDVCLYRSKSSSWLAHILTKSSAMCLSTRISSNQFRLSTWRPIRVINDPLSSAISFTGFTLVACINSFIRESRQSWHKPYKSSFSRLEGSFFWFEFSRSILDTKDFISLLAFSSVPFVTDCTTWMSNFSEPACSWRWSLPNTSCVEYLSK